MRDRGSAPESASVEVRPSVAARRRARRRRIIVLGTAGAVVLMAAGGGVALAVTGGEGSRYRTVAAEKSSVEQLIDSVGTIASATRRDASFSVAGTVAGVNVSVGQVVAAGDTLATLDTEALQDAVDKAQADLATAQQQLSDDLASQSSSSSSPSPSPSPTPPTTPSTPEPSASTEPTDDVQRPAGASDPAVAQAVEDVQHAQQALLDQYQVAADALAASGDSVTASQASCAAFLAVVPADVTGSDEDATDPTDPADDPTDPTDDPTAPADPTDDPTDPADPDPSAAIAQALADCQAALSGALDAQTATDAQQQALMTLARALDDSVAALQKAIAQSTSNADTPSDPSSSNGDSPSDPSKPSDSSTSSPQDAASSDQGSSPSGGDGATSEVASAATILADQAAIDLAEANVALAQSKLPFATLTSPIAGTVAAVSLAVGDSVEASSTTAVVTVIGTNGYTVTTTIPLNKIDIVQVGQTAAVSTPSTDTQLTGTVSSIGILDASDTGEPAYTVVLALDATDVQLYDGASATVRISVAGADEVLTVPTSAVHVDGSTATVQVLKDGTPTDVTVTVGAVGAERTEITDGLSLGQEVVLADLDQPIDTGTSTSNGGLSGLGDEGKGPGPESFVIQGVPGGGAPPAFKSGG